MLLARVNLNRTVIMFLRKQQFIRVKLFMMYEQFSYFIGIKSYFVFYSGSYSYLRHRKFILLKLLLIKEITQNIDINHILPRKANRNRGELQNILNFEL